MKRKNKDIEQGDANSVAAVHEAVTWMSWKLIEEYEDLQSVDLSAIRPVCLGLQQRRTIVLGDGPAPIATCFLHD